MSNFMHFTDDPASDFVQPFPDMSTLSEETQQAHETTKEKFGVGLNTVITTDDYDEIHDHVAALHYMVEGHHPVQKPKLVHYATEKDKRLVITSQYSVRIPNDLTDDETAQIRADASDAFTQQLLAQTGIDAETAAKLTEILSGTPPRPVEEPEELSIGQYL